MTPDELIQKYEQLKIGCDITRYPDSIEFRLSNLDGWLLEKGSLTIINAWGTVELEQISQAQEWLRVEQELKNLGLLRN